MHTAPTEHAQSNPDAVASSLRRWLFSGKCQSESGAFCAWRDAESGELAFEYPEITGYLLTFAAGLPDPTPNELAAARRGADWLVSRLGGGDYSARSGWDSGAIYTFDLGMVASGLISFGREHGDEYVETGVEVVRFLVSESEAAGKVPAVARGPRAEHTGWANEGRAHLLKLVQCLLLGGEFGVVGARDWAKSLIEEAADLQQPDGRFLTAPQNEITMLHPHHYALEGLWIWGTANADKPSLERARKGLEWAFAQQLASGGFPRLVANGTRDRGLAQADATAQAVRMTYLLELGPGSLGRAVRQVAELTVGDDQERAAVYRPDAVGQHQNVWASMFAAQALSPAASGNLEWHRLV